MISKVYILSHYSTLCPKSVALLCFRLYNKDAVIEYLLDKSAERPNAEAVVHIRGTKVC